MQISDLAELYDSRPLAGKIESFLRLLESMKARADRLNRYRVMWATDTDNIEVEAKRASTVDTRVAFLKRKSLVQLETFLMMIL